MASFPWSVSTSSPVSKSPLYLLSFTFFANQTPLAWVTHSLEWMPVSIQIAGRLVPPVLNWKRGREMVRGQLSSQALVHPLQESTPGPEASCSLYI